MTKPVILLVPGAWHEPSCFSPLASYLVNHGYTVEGISLPSVDSSPPQPNFDGDVAAVASTIRKHADQGSEIVVFFHSYGGIPGSSACRGLLKSDREARGKAGGVTHLIFCSAHAVDEGVSVMDNLGGEPLPWFNLSEDGMTSVLEGRVPAELFYNDIDDEKVLAELLGKLKPQSYGAFWSKSTYAAWQDVDSTYVHCERDNAIPVAFQRQMVANVRRAVQERGAGGRMHDVTLDASHSAFVSRPEEVGMIVRRAAGEKV
ncbi:hypothetical protein PV08_04200 [Exophiala spinifera]|uniref:AB hydrolase-1 domain-containing protein n=1 Tax=Exophiala spinifera TaxID=91928 RepID=A0A0D2C0B1_9EURO|nr:uncharacterized protein PV08_04200 [Exophiala spinifera]KIW17009.1 hypothetical protein PV08_04200 [Exophiala spinifera]